jgi:nitrous oxide reductase accessory protein NosL
MKPETNLNTKMPVELTSIARSFASDLAKLPEWDGPKNLDQFSDDDWTRFAEYVANDDGTLGEDDQELCEEIASAIENA